jgi:hypothetical protein
LIGELSAAAESVVAVFGERLSVYNVDCVKIWLVSNSPSISADARYGDAPSPTVRKAP